MKPKALSLLIISTVGIFGLLFFFLLVSGPPSTAQTGDILDEESLIDIAIEAARLYGLKSEPEILISEYISAKEWGPMMGDSRAHRNPELLVFVLSLRGEFEPGKSGGFSVPPLDPDGSPEDEFAPEGYTFGINARTGFITSELTMPVTDLDSMTTVTDRALYESMAREERQPYVEPVSFEDPRSREYFENFGQTAPENTAELLPLPSSP
jgi:hypothetical protein